MPVKTFWTVCAVFTLATLLLFVTGNLSMLVAVIVGFIAFGLTFMGMMNVLPLMVSHPAEAKPAKLETVAIQPMRETPAKAFNVLKSA